ncbi:hypothetical protein [Faecalibacillus intestinalis]|uniref:hypothetical protein n=1 Tax=Faecalibacillus intestinalis TaxID=1982626 RepID=UPI003990BAF6
MKIKFGELSRVDGGAIEDIIVESALPNKIKDILIGGGMTLLGIGYLCYTAFKNGVEETTNAEKRAYKNAGYLDENGYATVITPELEKQIRGEK